MNNHINSGLYAKQTDLQISLINSRYIYITTTYSRLCALLLISHVPSLPTHFYGTLGKSFEVSQSYYL